MLSFFSNKKYSSCLIEIFFNFQDTNNLLTNKHRIYIFFLQRKIFFETEHEYINSIVILHLLTIQYHLRIRIKIKYLHHLPHDWTQMDRMLLFVQCEDDDFRQLHSINIEFMIYYLYNSSCYFRTVSFQDTKNVL